MYFKTNMRLSGYFFDIIFPKKCLSCKKEGTYLCPECFAKIPIKTTFHCHICHKRSPCGKTCPECKEKAKSALTGLLIASDWRNLLVKQLIYECKYRFIRELTQPLALIMAKFLTSNHLTAWPTQSHIIAQTDKLINWSTDKLILIPIPLHKRRENWRGFNQAKIICNHLTEYLNILTIENLIIRDRQTPPQMDIKDKTEREKNVAGAFKLNPGAEKNCLKGKIIILIDDVCTTGATFNECAQSLRDLKPKEIWGLAIARG